MLRCFSAQGFHLPVSIVLFLVAATGLTLASCAPAPSPTQAPAAPTVVPQAAAAPTTQQAAAPKPAAPAPVAAPAATEAAPAAKPAAPAAAKPASRDKIMVRTTWKIAGQDAPYWLGLEKGFYAEEGFDAEVNEGSGSVPALQTVAAGTDHFAVSIDFATLMKGIGNGIPVKSVGTLFQKSSTGISAHTSANIKTIQDVTGKSIHFVPGGSTAQIFPALLKLNGIDASKVTIVNLDQLTGKQAFLAKRVDAMGSYATNEAIELEIEGVPTTFVSFADYAPILGTGLVTSEKLSKENPELVRRFIRAIQKTWTYAINNPEETTAVAVKRFPVLESKQKLILAQVKSLKGVAETEESKKLSWGTHQKDRWEKSQDFLLQVGLLEKKLPVEQYFTNDLLPR